MRSFPAILELDDGRGPGTRIEQVKRFAVIDRELTQEAGELTPTMKVKRQVVYDRERETLERLYE